MKKASQDKNRPTNEDKNPNEAEENQSDEAPRTPTKKSTPKKKSGVQVHEKFNKAYLQVIMIFLAGLLTSVVITQLLPAKKSEPLANVTTDQATANVNATPVAAAATADVDETDVDTVLRPTFAMYTKRQNQDNLSVIRKILKLFGYTEVGLNDDWNLLWGFESPFPNYRDRIMQLQPYQMVNHAPGMNFIVTKVELSTSGNPHMPRAFRLPKDKKKFKEYAAKHPEKIFVEKGNGHRNVSIKKPQDINLNSESTFIQEFLTNPYLVDGYKFDIGIYTVITSVDPVRLYIYTGDVMFRYCQEKFHPFDPDVLEKYVVGDKYRPTWEVPSLVKYFEQFGGGMRASFDAYVRDQGQDPSKIWAQAEEVIRDTVLSQAHNIAERWEQYPVQNFYELIRVDLIVDTDLKVHLIEANLSPNMYSKRFVHNYIVFEQALYNALRLVGVGTPIKDQEALEDFGQPITAVTDDKNIASNLNDCAQKQCHLSCDDAACDLCLPCMEDNDYDVLVKAQREHIHRGDMRRIFPKAISDVKTYDLAKETKYLTERNKWLTQWYYYKCLYDRSWCQ